MFIIEYYMGTLVPALLNVALMTLFERKWLGYTSLRLGPNKVGMIGILQPLSDVMKLFFKMTVTPYSSIKILYLLSPVLSLLLALLMMMLIPSMTGVISWEYLFLVTLTIFSLGVYPVMLAGWSSNNKYSLLGSMRSVAQTISYEISLAIFILVFFLGSGCLSIFESYSVKSIMMVWCVPLVIFWLVCILAEMHRAPFDFTEGESELVSGFNIEYGSPLFAVIFMSEYLMIFTLSVMTSCMVLNYGVTLLASTSALTIASLVVWSRSTLPRYRYDLLMELAWKIMLPWSLGLAAVFSMIFIV